MSTPERKIVEAVADSVAAAYVEYLTPPKYEAKYRKQEVQITIQMHYPYHSNEDGTTQCACGTWFDSETLWSHHLADKLFPA